MKTLFSLNVDYSKRVYGLDVFRAIAILVVVLTHGGFLLTGPLNAFPWIKLPDGVDLFFVLSGFLIGSMLLKQLETSPDFTGKDLLHFWKRRWFRTIPAYYLVLLLNYLWLRIGLIDGNPEVFGWRFFVFMQNFASPLSGFFWESWSLSVEEWFYLILPVICLFAVREMKVKQAFLLAISLLIILPLLYRISISGQEVDGYWYDVSFRKLVVTRLDAIGFGVLAAWLKYYYKEAWQQYKLPLFFLGFIGSFALIYMPKDVNGFFEKTILFSLVPLFMALLLPHSESVKSFKTTIGKVFTHISLISYSMYLINLALVADVIKKHFPLSSFGDGLLKYTIFWMIVIAGSTLLYKFFERPMTELRDNGIKN